MMMTDTEREARRWAKEMVALEYAVIDEIWNRRRVRYESVATDYDAETVKEIARRMPNLLVRRGGVALDELAEEYNFASTCDLVDMFATYTPKRVRLAELEEQYLNQQNAVRFVGYAVLRSGYDSDLIFQEQGSEGS